MKINNRFSRNLVATSVALALPSLASAQQLEEVMVTATKRAESTQDIPMSVEAVSGEKLNNMAIADFAALSDQIPNFHVGDGLVTTNVNMRGTGSGGDRSFEQSVGMFIDDIYMPRSRQYRSPFFDAERVEVLRGPQAVLFGLNSTAGAVAIHTARTRPGDAFSADVTLSYETEYEGTKASVAIGGSPTDTLGLRLAAEYLDSDGFYENTFSGKTEGNREAELIRLSAVWEPTDTLYIDAKYEWTEYDQDGNHGEVYGPVAADGDGKLNWKRNVDNSLLGTYPAGLGTTNVKPGLYQDIENIAINADLALGDHTLTAIFGYSDMEYSFALDLDTIPLPLFDASITPETYEQTSLELRWTSPGGETFDYVAGLYYQDSELFNDNEASFGFTAGLGPETCAALGLCGLAEYGSNTQSVDQELWSAYGNVTWTFNDTMRAIIGARYSDESKDAARGGACKIYDPETGTIISEGFATCTTFYTGIQGDRSSSNFMPEAVLQWDIGEESMLYGKVGTSAKSGGFATSSNILPGSWEYDDEEVITYELGYKARFGGGIAELNAVLFRSEYDDLQVNSFITDEDGFNPVGIISNAGSTINQGLEVDGRWAAADWLTVGGSMSFLDAEYDEFETGACYVGETTPDPAGVICDKSGDTPPYAPEFSGTVFADLAVPMGSNLNFVGNVTAAYSDSYYTDGTLDPVAEQDSYTRISARAGIEAADGKWSLAVIGRNLTEEEVIDVTQPLFGWYLGYIGAPRTITVQGTYRFGN